MTKRDMQASAYASESYEKPPAERGVSNTFDLISDANAFLLDMATRRFARTHYEGCRKEHVECLVAALVGEIARLRGDAEVARLRIEAAHAEIERLRQFDRSQPITPADDTSATHTTRDEGSVHGQGTETLGVRMVQRVLITQSLLDDNEKLRVEIDQLREAIRRLAEQDGTLSVQDGSVTVDMDFTLTAEEREAIEAAAWACGRCDGFNGDPRKPALYKGNQVEATLRNLLERLK